MANGLQVVSIRIPAVEGSAVGSCLHYYDQQTPEAIAQAIMQVDLDKGYDGRKILKELDVQFVEALDTLLKDT